MNRKLARTPDEFVCRNTTDPATSGGYFVGTRLLIDPASIPARTSDWSAIRAERRGIRWGDLHICRP